jgi:photosystem II stability/assembly factor-like uncharacterized protein
LREEDAGMAKKVLVFLGTNKGAFILESDAARRNWAMRGPYCDGWVIHHVIFDPESGAIFAAGGNPWTGVGVWRSHDLGETWENSGEGLAYGEEDPPIKSVWSLSAAHGRLHAGVEPAGLFASDDGGKSFSHVAGLRDHPTRPEWQAGGGGMILHSLVPDPHDSDQLWVGISVAGVYHTGDGGKTWTPRNRGTRADYAPEDQRYPEYGQCVHSVARAPGRAERLYQQNHCGMYRSDDGGRAWESIEEGLPSSFGFPVVVHPSDPDTVWLIPLNGDQAGRFVPDAKAAVWRSTDAGKTWTDLRNGLPQKDAYLCILRQAFAADTLDRTGLYFGSNSGSLFASADEGESWNQIAQHLPIIFSVETAVVDT